MGPAAVPRARSASALLRALREMTPISPPPLSAFTGEGAPAPASGQESLEPLTRALASGRATFSGSLITAQRAASSRGIRRLQAKMRTIFAAFPDVIVGDQGVRHE